jgi:hypothetical protein
MAETTEDENGTLPEADQWRTVLVGMHLRFNRILLEFLISKEIITSEEAYDLMHQYAEELRTGAHAAGTEDVAYYLAQQIERLADVLGKRKP